jgi:hypothetical protein
MRRSLLFLAGLTVLTGCPVNHQSPPARAQEAASECNLNTRFGRMELAAERVSPQARDPFFERRRAWGGRVRVADYEMLGLRMKGSSDAEVFVKIAWYRIDEGDLHVTTLKQKWHDFKGGFQLVDESREGGDLGLLGEHVATPPPAPKRNAQFPTIKLGMPAPAPAPEPEPEPAPAAEPRPAAPSEN